MYHRNFNFQTSNRDLKAIFLHLLQLLSRRRFSHKIIHPSCPKTFLPHFMTYLCQGLRANKTRIKRFLNPLQLGQQLLCKLRFIFSHKEFLKLNFYCKSAVRRPFEYFSIDFLSLPTNFSHRKSFICSK